MVHRTWHACCLFLVHMKNNQKVMHFLLLMETQLCMQCTEI